MEQPPKCIGCGKEAVLEDNCWKGVCHYSEGIYCRKCYKKIVDKYIAEFDGNTNYTHNIVCPKCGYEFIDSWEIGEGEIECYRCEHEFYVERNIDVTYSTR